MKHLITVAAVLLSACATVYKPPTAGPTATLFFDIDSGGAPVPGVAIFREAERCGGGGDDVKLQNLGASRYRASTLIPAKQDLSFMILTVFTPECVLITTFTPEEGRQYIAAFKLKRAEGYCEGTLYRVTESSTEREPTLRHRKFTRPFSGSGEFCSAGDVPPNVNVPNSQ